MLKSLDTSRTFSHFVKTKCAEVFYQNAESFTIICTFCEMKSFEFGDFVLHFNNVHLQGKEKDEDVIIKSELDDVENDFHIELLEENEGPVSTKENNEEMSATEPDGFKTIKEFDVRMDCAWSELEDDSGSDNTHTGDDYVPRILANSSKRVQKPTYKCDSCSKTYKQSKMLDEHIKKFHRNTLNYKCPRCERVFHQDRDLDKHLLKQHAGFECEECHKVYKSRRTLHIHKLKHTGVSKFICNIENCGKSFFTSSQLARHKYVVHVAIRNFVCETCGFRTKTNSALVVHNRSHTGERPYKCKLCGKGFASQSLLCEHQPIHSTERPHKCKVCGAAFSRPKALYHHKHLHLDVKKYVCKICDKAYAQAAGLAGHMRQHKSEF